MKGLLQYALFVIILISSFLDTDLLLHLTKFIWTHNTNYKKEIIYAGTKLSCFSNQSVFCFGDRDTHLFGAQHKAIDCPYREPSAQVFHYFSSPSHLLLFLLICGSQ